MKSIEQSMMQERRPTCLRAAGALFLLLSWIDVRSAVSAGPELMPDASTGNINGHQAVLVWPTTGSGLDQLVPDVSDCVVHVDQSASEDDLEFPCGKWFLPPVGRSRTWVETHGWIADVPTVTFYDGGIFHGAGMRLVTPVVPAGTVKLHYTGAMKPGSTVRFISFPKEGYYFDRDVSLADAEKGAHLPAGRVAIAGVFDQDNRAVAVSRPFSVKASGVTDARIESSSTDAGLYAVLTRPYDRSGPSKTPVSLVLDLPSGPKSPDFIYGSPSRILAVWYGLPPSKATLRAVASSVVVDSIPLTLAKGQVSTTRQSLHFQVSGPDTPDRQH